MRRVLHGDVVALARALLDVPAPRRAATAARLVAEAHAADRYRRRTGRVHSCWGNGALRGRVLRAMGGQGALAPEPFPSDPIYAACLITALEAITARAVPVAGQPPPAQDTQRSAARSSRRRAAGISSPHSSHSP